MTWSPSTSRSDWHERAAGHGAGVVLPLDREEYGEPVTHWKQVIRTPPGYATEATHLQLVAVLKEQHGLGHGHANAVVAHTLAEDKA